jgi:hypothetical protein
MKQHYQWILAFCVLICVFVAGCGGPSNPATAPAGGTIVYNGAPVEGAMVSFQPQDTPRPATGTTDAQGEFTLSTYGQGDGAIPGNYNVIVTKTSGSAGTEGMDEDALLASPEAMGTEEEAKALLPAKYAVAASSGLTARVEAGKENDFKFELTD